MRFPKVYAVQIMIPLQMRPLGPLLCTHLATYAAENPHSGRTLLVDMQADPETQAIKDKFLALRSWTREVLGGGHGIKAFWAPRWVLVHPRRSRVVHAGIKQGVPFVTTALAEEAGMELKDIQTEIAELFN